MSLGESLVKAGYGRLVNWGLEMMSLGAHSLREAERNAKQQRLAIWRNYVAPASAGTAFSPASFGVLEVAQGWLSILLVLVQLSHLSILEFQDLLRVDSQSCLRLGYGGVDTPDAAACDAQQLTAMHLQKGCKLRAI